jgi:hypothetical protein
MKWAAPNRTWQPRPVLATSPRASLTGKKAQKRTDKSGKFVMVFNSNVLRFDRTKDSVRLSSVGSVFRVSRFFGQAVLFLINILTICL